MLMCYVIRQDCFRLKSVYYVWNKDSLQEALFHPSEPCEGCFITVHVLYFKSSKQDPANPRLVPL